MFGLIRVYPDGVLRHKVLVIIDHLSSVVDVSSEKYIVLLDTHSTPSKHWLLSTLAQGLEHVISNGGVASFSLPISIANKIFMQCSFQN